MAKMVCKRYERARLIENPRPKSEPSGKEKPTGMERANAKRGYRSNSGAEEGCHQL